MVYLIVSIARQKDFGEHVFAIAEKAYKTKNSADAVLASMSKDMIVEGYQCSVENGVIEVDSDFVKGEKAYVAMSLARQQGGEYVFVNIEKMSRDRNQIEKYIETKLEKEVVMIATVQCLVERGIVEVILEE